jgi:hypothetical protein
MASPDYTPLAHELPDVYREHAESFAQVESYLGLADELQRSHLDILDDLTAWLSPLATGMWPPGLLPDAGAGAVLDAQLAALDEAARWVGFAFPPSWPRDGAGLAKRRDFLLKAARLWRRRATPRGFLDWFCLALDVTARAERPFLLEHFKFGAPLGAGGTLGPDPGLRATLFVPASAQFLDYSRRREAIGFVERNAPAHVLMRVCWVDESFAKVVLGPFPAADAKPAEIKAFQEHVQRVLCSLVSKVEHKHALRIWTCIDEGRDVDRLGIGRLPGGGDIPDDT